MSNRNAIETLEGRTLLSANAFVDGNHVLHVRGFENLNNAITVGNNVDGTGIDISVVGTGATTKNFSTSFANTRGITRVVIVGGHLGDAITINETNSPFALKTRIEGRRGNDTINAGAENDLIAGGRGDDIINANGGDDKVFGGRGADQIDAGDGNDTVWGGLGNDVEIGGLGNDKLGGVAGTNVLTGGDGNDIFIVKSLTNNPDNDFDVNVDTLKLAGKNGVEPPDPAQAPDQGV